MTAGFSSNNFAGSRFMDFSIDGAVMAGWGAAVESVVA